MNSILNTVKKIIGISEDDTSFDTDIIMFINTAISSLQQLTNIPNFEVTDTTQVWEDLSSDISKSNLIKSYISLKVKTLFDPPMSSIVKEAIDANLNEIAFRIGNIGD